MHIGYISLYSISQWIKSYLIVIVITDKYYYLTSFKYRLSEIIYILFIFLYRKELRFTFIKQNNVMFLIICANFISHLWLIMTLCRFDRIIKINLISWLHQHTWLTNWLTGVCFIYMVTCCHIHTKILKTLQILA